MSEKLMLDFDYEELLELKNAIRKVEDNLKTVKSSLDKYERIYFEANPKKGLQEIIPFLEYNMELEACELPEEYGYSCLPLCLIDAIYSIGVKYSATKRVVKNYCDAFNIEIIKENELEVSHTISDLLNILDNTDLEVFAKDTLKNMQRTSPRNGVLKIKAVYECAKILKENDIETKADFNKKFSDEIEKKFKDVKGQKSGISLDYLKMLCGEENKVKPDRHIIRFLNEFYSDVTVENAEDKLREIVNHLKDKYEKITLRKLDYMIWKYMSEKKY